MGFDEERYQLRREREQIEDDFDDYRREHRHKEERLNDTIATIQYIINDNRERIDAVLRNLTDNQDYLIETYDEYQEFQDQVHRFALEKSDELDMEFAQQKKLYNQKLDKNDSQYASLLRREKEK